MLPIPDKSYVTGEYVVDWNFIRSHQPYIILTREEGVVFKITENKLQEEGKLVLHSLNPLYNPYDLPANDIMEVWKFVHFISSEMPESNRERDPLSESVIQLQKEVKAIQMRLNL
jgi:hypothetical protein